MKIFKKILKIFCLVLLLFTLVNNINLNAIIIDINQEGGGNEENDGNKNPYGLCRDYSINVDEDNNIGYLERSINGNSVVLGTCEVIIIDTLNPNGYVLCDDDNNSLGTITILIDSNDEEKGAIVNVNGEIDSIISINDEVSIIE